MDSPTESAIGNNENVEMYLRGDGLKYVKRLEAENEHKDAALIRLQNWANAYPLTVFPKPDLEKAHKLLQAGGMTLDAISADAMRYVVSGIKDIVEQALKGGE